jgi:hypothetical protein
MTTQNKTKTNSVAFTPQANNIDRAAGATSEASANVCGLRDITWSAQRVRTVVNLGFLNRSRYFSSKQFLGYPHEAERTPFQTHYFSENLIASGMEPGTSGSTANNT